MLLIVAHHYVVNSGLTGANGPMQANPLGLNTLYLWTLGMWGKTGINCFLMITGYFMCKSQITPRKFVKLLFQIYFYELTIFVLFACCGYETLSLQRVAQLIMPVWGIETNFVSCFLLFWLTIPFWNILIKHMSKQQHQRLLALLLGSYTLLGSVPTFHVSFNYVTWFGVIYLIASYIRLYPHRLFEHTRLWAVLSLSLIVMAIGSVWGLLYLTGGHAAYYFVSDSNKILAVGIAITTFLWFKNMQIAPSRLINYMGAATFGVLLIHANSDAMRRWLWIELVDCVGHYSLSVPQLALYSVSIVIAIFVSCVIIDQIRLKCVEKPFFKWYDKRF